MKIYLAGPMTGIDQSNFPAFDTAAAYLRGYGWDVVSPAELDDPEVRKAALANLPVPHTWGDFLARDVKLIADSDITGIVFLPEWWTSRGARLEAQVGLLKSPTFSFWELEYGKVWDVTREYVSNRLHYQVIREAA